MISCSSSHWFDYNNDKRFKKWKNKALESYYSAIVTWYNSNKRTNRGNFAQLDQLDQEWLTELENPKQ